MEKLKEVVWWIIGFFMTVLFTPLTFSMVTYALFPRMSWTFIQLYWVITMVWLCINYITITLEKAIDRNKK